MKFTHEIINHEILVIHLEENLMSSEMNLHLAVLLDECLERNLIFCAIDLSSIEFINSAGLSILIRILSKFRNKNGEVVLIKPSEKINQLLIITKLNAIFTVARTKEEAVKMLKS